MRRSREEGDRIALRLPAEMKLEAERLARLSGEHNVSDYYRNAIEAYNERVRGEIIDGRHAEPSSEAPGVQQPQPERMPPPFEHLKARPA